MQTRIEVQDTDEAKLLKSGLADEGTRALVKIIGALAPLESDRAKRRVLGFVRDHFDETNN